MPVSDTPGDAIVEHEYLGLSLSYFGMFITHPGAKLSVEVPFLSFYKQWDSRNGELDFYLSQFLAGASLGFYYHEDNHTALFLTGDIGYRFLLGSFCLDVVLGLGYLRTFYDAAVYSADSGDPELQTAGGADYFMPMLSLGIGQDMSLQYDVPIAWSLKPSLFLYVPFGTTTALNFSVEFTLRYSFRKVYQYEDAYEMDEPMETEELPHRQNRIPRRSRI